MSGRDLMACLVVSGLVGCGVSRNEFVPEYAASYCDYYMECGDQAQLTFDGVLTTDDCIALYGPDIEAQNAACKFKNGAAKDCLETLPMATCPADGDVDAGLPVTCHEVYVNCAPLVGVDPEEGS